MRLLLVRHGQTPANVAGALDTAIPGAPLTALGRLQAAAIPSAFATERVRDIFVSTLLRTQQTAAPLADTLRLEPTVLDGLREITAGDLELRDDKKSQGEYVTTCFAWARGDLDLRMPGGENGHEFFARYDAAMSVVLQSDASTLVVVSHGAAIRTWVAARCVNTDGAFAEDHALDNTGMAELQSLDDGRWKLLDWHRTPVGSASLADPRAEDPTGELVE